MKQRVDAAEYLEWMAFYAIDPWGGHRIDLGAAVVASTIANVNRASTTPAMKIDDFMSYDQYPPPPLTAAETLDRLKMYFNQFAAK